MSEPFDPEPASDPARMTAWVSGRVQGVGFRWWTTVVALELGLTGSAVNLADGRVRVVAEGPVSGCRQLLAAIRTGAGVGRVDGVAVSWSDPGGMTGFTTG